MGKRRGRDVHRPGARAWSSSCLRGAALALVFTACTANAYEQDLAQEPVTVVERDGIEVRSPYAADATGSWADLVFEEAQAVATLFDVPAEDVQVRLIAVDAPEDVGEGERLLATLSPDRDGIRGWAGATDEGLGVAIVYVPRDPMAAMFASFSAREVVRHELVHVFSRRVGFPPRGRWLSEGLARQLEAWELGEDDRLAPPSPALSTLSDLRAARHPEITVAELLAWDMSAADATDDPVGTALRYALSASFVDHLSRVYAAQTTSDTLRTVAALDEAALLAQESPWRERLAAVDPLGEVEALVADPDDERAGEAVMRLRVLFFDMRQAGVDWTRGDALAFAALDRPALRDSVATYLLLGRAKRLEAGAVDGLAASPDPELRLLAAALTLKRGGEVDAREVIDTWNALPSDRTLRLGMVMSGLRDVAEFTLVDRRHVAAPVPPASSTDEDPP